MAKPNVPKGTSVSKCVGLLPDAMAQEFVDLHPNSLQGSPDGIHWAQGRIDAGREAMKRLDLHILRNGANSAVVNSHKSGVVHGARALLIPDYKESVSALSIESHAKAVKGKLDSMLSDAMDKYRPRALGFARDKEGMRNFVLEVFGKSTGDQEASEMANAWTTMAEYVRLRLNAAGASIPKLKDWGMPQSHNPSLVSESTAEDWTKFVVPLLDIDRMAKESGLTKDAVINILKTEVYPTIVSEGAHKIDLSKVSGRPQGRSLLTKLKDSRFMHFKDGESWMAYQDKYGNGYKHNIGGKQQADYLQPLIEFVDRQAVNIAAMEVLGPDPEIGLQHLKNILRKEGIERGEIDYLDALYRNVVGEVGTSNKKWADVMAGIRAFNVVAHLGNATLSMLTDPAFLATTAKINDVPIVKTFVRQMKIISQQGLDTVKRGRSAGPSQLKLAAEIGLTAEYAADRLVAAARYTDARPTKFMRRASEITMRLNFMHPITIASRAAFQLEYSAALAKDAGKAFDELSKARQDAFRRVGITEQDWEIARKQGVIEHPTGKYFDINAIGRRGNKAVATKFFGLMAQETDYAVPTPGAAVRTFINRGNPRGSAAGETTRTIGEFKSFPITMTMMHLQRIFYTRAVNRWGYGGALIGSLLILGYLALVAKEVSKGRDIPSLTDDEGNPDWITIGRAAFQAGALGIYGDLLFQDVTRFGGGLGQTLGGPTVGLATDALGLGQQTVYMGVEQIQNIIDGDNATDELEKFVSRIRRAVQTYKPEVWQIRAIEDRAVNKFFEQFLEPDLDRTIRRAERTREKQFGQSNYWAEDEWLPERWPEVAEGAPAE